MNARFSSCLSIAVILSFFALTAEAGDAAAGKPLYPVCTACHGPTGQGNQAMNAPKIAGQHDWYIARQLKLFQLGARGTAKGDMQGMQMAAMSKGPQLKAEGALDNLAAYIASFPDTKPPVTVTGDVAAGKRAYATCAACHGAQGQGVEALSGPALAGQNDWYLVNQVKKFKSGQRGYHKLDNGGRQMRPMAGMLANDDAINNVVAYINTFK